MDTNKDIIHHDVVVNDSNTTEQQDVVHPETSKHQRYDHSMLDNLPDIVMVDLFKLLNDLVDKVCLALCCKRLMANMNKLMVSLRQNAQRNTPYRWSETTELPESITWMRVDSSLRQSNIPFPKSLAILELGGRFNQMITPLSLPDTITNLSLGYFFNQPINVGDLPQSLQTLSLGSMFSQPLQIGSLPSSLTTLILGDYYNNVISVGTLPQSLQTLTLGSTYSLPIQVGSLPPTLTSLTLGYNFNQPISNGQLPSSLNQLFFGYYFNSYIEPGSLPHSIPHTTHF
ncbi:hypothetical protein SAMD00019534_010910, partial [Acytostelium subglobosum LB1]|uniref:hypothetical protein n=1 Tax=Acytostelium subglobosum LB1 TaxID=1410327 RepID=UPI000644BF93